MLNNDIICTDSTRGTCSYHVTIRQMLFSDLFKTNNVNLDHLTENFQVEFYMEYLLRHPLYCSVAEVPDGTIAGYLIGRAEGHGSDWHSHVTAISVAPQYRQSKIATQLMNQLTKISMIQQCHYIDLFVRKSNHLAIAFYTRLGYSTYRTVSQYYTSPHLEDALEMRKYLKGEAISKGQQQISKESYHHKNFK